MRRQIILSGTENEKKTKRFSEVGTAEKIDYTMEISKIDGTKVLRPSGITETYAMIQTAKDETDINLIMQRRTRGDLHNFRDQTKAIYGDFSGIPDSMIEIANLKLKAEKAWTKLPLEVRKEYDQDFDKYFAEMGSEKWMSLHGFEKAVEKETIKEETAVDEQRK
ncbi:minor capsid protein [Capybara microvirus Cap3_SP_389]|nr:minor capsid protein [Capybara microvirus Cap3_SP_389]